MSAADVRDEPVGVLATLRQLPLAIWALLAGTLVNRLGAFLQIFLVLYLVERGFSAARAGLVLGVLGAGFIVGTLVGGWVTDRLGSRRTIALSMSGGAVLTVTVLYLDSYPAIATTVFLIGAVSQGYRPAAATMLGSLTPPARQPMVFAIYRLAFSLGTTAGPLLGAFLVQISFNLIFWVEALAAAAFAVIALLTLPRDTARAKAAEGRDDTGAGPVRGYLLVLADRRFALFLGALLLNTLVYFLYLSALPLSVQRAGHPATVYGLLVTLNAVVVVAVEVVITKYTQRWPARVAVVAGMALMAAGMSMYGLPLGIAGLVVATVIWSLGETVGGPTIYSYGSRAARPGLKGRYLASVEATISIGFALSPTLGAAAWSRFGDGIWALCALVGLGAVTAAAFGVRPNRELADTSDVDKSDVDVKGAEPAVKADG